MKPHNFHAPGLPSRLPDQPIVRDKDGHYVSGGRPSTYGKVLRNMRKHHQEELKNRRRDG